MSCSDNSEMLDLTVSFNLGEQSDIDSDFERLHVHDGKEEKKMPHLPSDLDKGYSIQNMESPLTEIDSLIPSGTCPTR